MAAVGGQRVVNFSKYLPEYGWIPIVLTVKKGVNSSWDHSLLDEIKEVKVYRSLSFEPLLKRAIEGGKQESYKPDSVQGLTASSGMTLLKRLKRFIKNILSVPDFAILWIPFGVIKGLRVIRKEKISVIVSSSPPVSSHIIASILARITGLPHIVDFRDLWTLNHVYHEREYPKYIKRYDRFWERFVLRGTDWVVTASPGFTRQMKELNNGMLGKRVSTITNGFDYNEIDLDKTLDGYGDGIMRFMYAGSLYSHFNPVFFLECFSEWLERSEVNHINARIDFYGGCDYDYNQYVRDLNLEDKVFFHGFKSRSELLPLMARADRLLIFLGFETSCANVIPAKLFEYLAAGSPILSLAPEGVTSDIIAEYNAGYTISKGEKETMIALLERCYDDWKTKEAGLKRFHYIEEIDRERLTGRLAELLDRARTDLPKETPFGLRHKAL